MRERVDETKAPRCGGITPSVPQLLRTPNPLPGRRWRDAYYSAVLLLCVAAGCQHDARIGVNELTELEQRAAQSPAVPVEAKQLALTEYQPYKVGPGDVLAITLIGTVPGDFYAPVSMQLRVHDDGKITVPVAGPIHVAGLDFGQVEQAITDANKDKYTGLSVFVQLANQESTTVLVQGAATLPGLVKLKHNECNPLYAVAAAGGFGIASSGLVRLKPIRPERPAITFNFNEINDVRRALLGPPLESGDVLVVESLDASAVYVTGLVQKPGAIPVPPTTTLSVQRAIASAGGLRDYLDIKEGTLVRVLPDGQQVQVKVDLAGVLAGTAQDIAMKPGDILSIPYTLDTLAQEWFLRNIVAGPFNVSLHYDPLSQYNAERALRSQSRGNALESGIISSLQSVIPQVFVPPTTAGQTP